MSKLDDLIAELCPDGVEYVELNSVLDYEQPTRYIVKNTNYSDEFVVPVLTAGQSFILGYTNEDTGIYIASKKNPVIIFDDFTTSFHWVDFDFKVKSSAMKMLKPKDETKTSFRYLYHLMRNIKYIPVDHTRQWIKKYSKFKIPLPPLPVQEEIVRILDDFTELTAELTSELTAELTARKKQYEYYRDDLLLFDDNVPRRTLGETCDIVTGGEAPENSIKGDCGDESHLYPIYANGKEVYGFTDTYKIDRDAVVISSIGANTGAVFFRKAYFTPIIRLKVVIPKDNNINPRYLYHAVSTAQFISKSGSVPNLNANDIKKIVVPIPSLEEQDKIVNILDRFDTIYTDIYASLSAEIEARQKQYEYYRDKILTFKECEK